jgi:formylmethanofuran dehydrogenase subunit C
VTPLVLTLRERPQQRLDLSPLVPHRLAGKTAAEIERLELQTTREKVCVGDGFRLRMGDVANIRIEGACERLDQVGYGMAGGEIEVVGDVGIQAGRLMTGGRLTISGDAGPWAGSGMRGGIIKIGANAGGRLGGPLAGETAGMRGGVIVVRGSAGERAADKLRRGTIIIEGHAGDYAGSRLIAGTLIVCGAVGRLPGYLMHRGTLLLGRPAVVSQTFIDCGVQHLVATRLLASYVAEHSRRAATLLRGPLRRLVGDMAVLGKGEIFTPV